MKKVDACPVAIVEPFMIFLGLIAASYFICMFDAFSVTVRVVQGARLLNALVRYCRPMPDVPHASQLG